MYYVRKMQLVSKPVNILFLQLDRDVAAQEATVHVSTRQAE